LFFLIFYSKNQKKQILLASYYSFYFPM